MQPDLRASDRQHEAEATTATDFSEHMDRYGDFVAPNPKFNLDFSTLEDTDVLKNFDFDSFLNTSGDDSYTFDGGVQVGANDNGLNPTFGVGDNPGESSVSGSDSGTGADRKDKSVSDIKENAATTTKTDLGYHYTITWDQTIAGGFRPELLAAADNSVRVRDQTKLTGDSSKLEAARFIPTADVTKPRKELGNTTVLFTPSSRPSPSPRSSHPMYPRRSPDLSNAPGPPRSPYSPYQDLPEYHGVDSLNLYSVMPDRVREHNVGKSVLNHSRQQNLQEGVRRAQEHNLHNTLETIQDYDTKPRGARMRDQNEHWSSSRSSHDSDRSAELETINSTPRMTDKHAEDGISEFTFEDLSTRLRILEAENARLRAASKVDLKNLPKPISPASPMYKIIYRIDTHDLYLDEPQWKSGTSDKLYVKSQMSIHNLERYLQRNPAIHFVVFREYKSEQDSTGETDLDNGILDPPVPFAESIYITSDKLLEAMAALLEAIPGLSFANGDITVDSEIPAPYFLFYHALPFWDLGVEDLDPDSQTAKNLLKDYVTTSQGENYHVVHSEFEQGLVSSRSIDYLVKPGDVIVGAKEGNVVALMALSWLKKDPVTSKSGRSDRRRAILEKHQHNVSSGQSTQHWLPDTTNSVGAFGVAEDERWRACHIKAWSWQYDGTFTKAHTRITIRFPIADALATTEISGLDFYPIRFANEEVRGMLAKRSATFWKLRVNRLVSYNRHGDNAEANTEDRYMIDMDTYHNLHPHYSTTPLKSDIDSEALKLDHPPQNGQEWLFPATIIGYQLSRKRWVDLDVDYISDVRWNKTAFESLVVSDKIKELIQALVTNQLAAKMSTDLISGKGNGLLILLHGGPGTGKTFTAEGVAEIAEKPLYRVTCGDIGTKPEAVEKYLQSVLELGKIWDCVVLLDEADVFLEERSFANLERNALVSVFLRILEYQDGIMILTSNRVGTFDAAFKSRIQLSLHYESLKTPSRRKIWRNLIKHLKDMGEEDVDYDDIADHIDDLAKEEMNGRQIRNAITTGRQLAKYQKKMLNYDHLDHVIQVGAKFDKYLQDVQSGLTEDEIARSDHIR